MFSNSPSPVQRRLHVLCQNPPFIYVFSYGDDNDASSPPNSALSVWSAVRTISQFAVLPLKYAVTRTPAYRGQPIAKDPIFLGGGVLEYCVWIATRVYLQGARELKTKNDMSCCSTILPCISGVFILRARADRPAGGSYICGGCGEATATYCGSDACYHSRFANDSRVHTRFST